MKQPEDILNKNILDNLTDYSIFRKRCNGNKRYVYKTKKQLYKWYISFVKNNNPKIEYKYWISINGYLENNNLIQSSPIIKTEGPYIIYTENTKYYLIGDSTITTHIPHAQFNKQELMKFKNGFPEDWKSIVITQLTDIYGKCRITSNLPVYNTISAFDKQFYELFSYEMENDKVISVNGAVRGSRVSDEVSDKVNDSRVSDEVSDKVNDKLNRSSVSDEGNNSRLTDNVKDRKVDDSRIIDKRNDNVNGCIDHKNKAVNNECKKVVDDNTEQCSEQDSDIFFDDEINECFKNLRNDNEIVQDDNKVVQEEIQDDNKQTSQVKDAESVVQDIDNEAIQDNELNQDNEDEIFFEKSITDFFTQREVNDTSSIHSVDNTYKTESTVKSSSNNNANIDTKKDNNFVVSDFSMNKSSKSNTLNTLLNTINKQKYMTKKQTIEKKQSDDSRQSIDKKQSDDSRQSIDKKHLDTNGKRHKLQKNQYSKVETNNGIQEEEKLLDLILSSSLYMNEEVKSSYSDFEDVLYKSMTEEKCNGEAGVCGNEKTAEGKVSLRKSASSNDITHLGKDICKKERGDKVISHANESGKDKMCTNTDDSTKKFTHKTNSTQINASIKKECIKSADKKSTVKLSNNEEICKKNIGTPKENTSLIEHSTEEYSDSTSDDDKSSNVRSKTMLEEAMNSRYTRRYSFDSTTRKKDAINVKDKPKDAIDVKDRPKDTINVNDITSDTTTDTINVKDNPKDTIYAKDIVSDNTTDTINVKDTVSDNTKDIINAKDITSDNTTDTITSKDKTTNSIKNAIQSSPVIGKSQCKRKKARTSVRMPKHNKKKKQD